MKDYFNYIYGATFLFLGVCFGYAAYTNIGKGRFQAPGE